MLNIFKNKKVIITGHTGFKGSWLTLWLLKLGAEVIGISKDIPTKPSHYLELNIKNKIKDIVADVTDVETIKEIFYKEKPDFVFHLAAQALVKKSYLNPIETWNTNTFGTLTILESLRILDNKCISILITSDKCYDNVEWIWGYKETDKIGGPDPYSASKGAAEILIRSYYESFLSKKSNIKIGIARAGNVIGGGDWALDRIIPDCMTAWSDNNIVKLRNPKSTRPWQHVLEPLGGYLIFAVNLYNSNRLNGEAFNFGPSIKKDYTVIDLVNKMSKYWKNIKWEDVSDNYNGPIESGLLKLNCDKANNLLNWEAIFDIDETISYTTNWYKNFYENKVSTYDYTLTQIESYEKKFILLNNVRK